MSGGISTRSAVDVVAGAGMCSHPVRLHGTALDTATGELSDFALVVACKDRRAILCPACADRYQGDTFQLVAAGLRGGKGVPASVAGHPVCFVTLTAPSFGAVHTRPATGSATTTCRPRRRGRCCPHGAGLGCAARHRLDDPVLGRPLCARCFDYDGAVGWNSRVSLLWQRTTTAMKRRIASSGGVSARGQLSAFRLSYVKVAEFQRRGLVHLHALVRADGPQGPGDPPPEWLDAAVLSSGIDAAVCHACAPGLWATNGDPRAVRWGAERTVRVVTGGDHDAVASYLAKYAVKAATDQIGLAHRITGDLRAALTRADPHTAALITAAWRLGGRPELRSAHLRAHAHTLGYGGHFSTKSRLWSTTLRQLREARHAHARAGAGDAPLVAGSFHFVGRGYGTPDADRLAEVLAEAIATRPRRVPTMSPQCPHDVPGELPTVSEQEQHRSDASEVSPEKISMGTPW